MWPLGLLPPLGDHAVGQRADRFPGTGAQLGSGMASASPEPPGGPSNGGKGGGPGGTAAPPGAGNAEDEAGPANTDNEDWAHRSALTAMLRRTNMVMAKAWAHMGRRGLVHNT